MPDGSIQALPVRGTLTGNRGILHDAAGQLGKARWRHNHWIACDLHYKGWQRRVMSPGTWTELFFLDEAVALAAGHRPCALCRRAEYSAFRAAWGRAFGAVASAAAMDQTLHTARICRETGGQKTYAADAESLPDGTFIRTHDRPVLITGASVLPHSPGGYGPPGPLPAGRVTVMTPQPIVAVLSAGYRPRLHSSARTAFQPCLDPATLFL
jgi:hypothetical protein